MDISKLKANNLFYAVMEKSQLFCADAEAFVRSNRFHKFVEYVETVLDDELRKSPFIEEYDGSPTYCFMDKALRNYIMDYNHKIRGKKDESQMKEKDSNFTATDAVSSFPQRIFSTLLMADVMYNEGTGADDEQYKQISSFSLSLMLHGLDTEMFCPLYNDALLRACYDFVYFKAIEHDLISENWFRVLKGSLGTKEIIWILNATFQYLLYSISDNSAFNIVCMKDEKSAPVLLKNLKEASDEKRKDEVRRSKELKAIKKKLEEEQQAHQKTQEQYADLKTSTASALNSAEEAKRLKRDLDELREVKQSLTSANAKLNLEIQKLKEQNQSLTDYVELLAQEEEPSSEETAELPQDSEVLYKRIVFVRDKRNEGYIMMQKLAEMFPNAKFTNCIASEIDANNTDAIVALISYTCHGTYWNASGFAKKNKIPLISIKNKNVNVIANRIQKELIG